MAKLLRKKSKILVDVIKSSQEKNGTIKRLTLPDLPTAHSSNPHDLSLSTAI